MGLSAFQILTDAFGEQPGLFDAIVEGHAAIGVAAKEQTGMPRQPIVDPSNPFEMAQMILWNGAPPSNDVMEDRRSLNPHGTPQFAANRIKEPVIVPIDHLGTIPTAAHGS